MWKVENNRQCPALQWELAALTVCVFQVVYVIDTGRHLIEECVEWSESLTIQASVVSEEYAELFCNVLNFVDIFRNILFNLILSFICILEGCLKFTDLDLKSQKWKVEKMLTFFEH